MSIADFSFYLRLQCLLSRSSFYLSFQYFDHHGNILHYFLNIYLYNIIFPDYWGFFVCFWDLLDFLSEMNATLASS